MNTWIFVGAWVITGILAQVLFVKVFAIKLLKPLESANSEDAQNEDDISFLETAELIDKYSNEVNGSGVYNG